MKTKANTAPLRKVIGELQVEAGEFQGEMLYYTHELYECFHHEMPKQDFIGDYHAVRRRCRQCAVEVSREIRGGSATEGAGRFCDTAPSTQDTSEQKG